MKNQAQLDMQREIEMQLERDHLSNVLEKISKELLLYIDKRKKFSEYIVEYRKNVIEEHKFDEDQVIDYFDHEKFVQEHAYKNYDRKMKELTVLKDSPYFGSIAFDEEGITENFYIGKHGFTPNASYEPVVLDWRVPIASLFYAGKTGPTTYQTIDGPVDVDITERRQYIIKHGELKGLFSSSIDIKDEILQDVLSKNTEEKLSEIITTIQYEQDQIIRQPKLGTCVVDGVAGSGKTTIALHRVAYLLYNFRDYLKDKILILGPNMIFMEYISEVLPQLGETGVDNDSFTEFTKSIAGVENVMSFEEYMERVFGNDEEFIAEVKRKSSPEYKAELDVIVREYNERYANYTDMKLRDKVVVTADELKEMHEVHYKDLPLLRRVKKIKRVLLTKLRGARDEIFYEMNQRYEEEKAQMSDEDKVLHENDLFFRRKVEITELIGDVVEFKEKFLKVEFRDCVEIYNEFNNNARLIKDDLAPIVYLKLELEGYKYDKEFKHVVIDEAQDLNLLELEVIKRVTRATTYTVVGDENQRILPSDSNSILKDYHKVLGKEEVKEFKLNKSYRSTKEIMEYANNYLPGEKVVPLVRTGEKVREFSVGGYGELSEVIRNVVKEYKEEEYESIAIICKNVEQARKINTELVNKVPCKLIENENIIYNTGTSVLPAYFGKGLEFDAVIMIDAENSEKLNYVMSTRALHNLVSVKLKNK